MRRGGREEDPEGTDNTIEAFELFTEFEARLRRLGADWEAPREVGQVGGDTSRGWVVVAVDRLMNGRPAVRDVVGPFADVDAARQAADALEESGTRVFVARLSDPARISDVE